MDALAEAVKASPTVDGPDLISVAAQLLALPEDIFFESPFDWHFTSSTFCVETAALALSDSLDVIHEFDERAAPSTASRLAHTTYSTRRTPTGLKPAACATGGLDHHSLASPDVHHCQR